MEELNYRFAPAGREVYNLACHFLTLRAPYERNRLPLGDGFCYQVSLLKKRDDWLCARSYKHFAPLEQKPNSLPP